jgi:two-component system, chemotaxis family, response regulator Rcp1
MVGADGIPMDVLLVEDSPGDVRLMREAFRDTNGSVQVHVASDTITGRLTKG